MRTVKLTDFNSQTECRRFDANLMALKSLCGSLLLSKEGQVLVGF